MKNLRTLYLIFTLLPMLAHAQFEEKLEEAYMLYKQDQFSEAAALIDEAVNSKKGEISPVAWHLRGFIYKDVYVRVDSGSLNSGARDTAISSLRKSILYDTEQSLLLNNRKALKFLSSSFFNDASDIVAKHKKESIDRANDQYLRYRSLTTYLFPDTIMQDKDIEFYLAMSTAHRRIYESDREKNDIYWSKSNDFLAMVLEIDPKNWPAFYSMSVSYYNKGAYNLEALPDADIPDIYAIQAESLKSIEIALPYMMKAYEINPEKIEAIKGLKWIYFNLHREEESEIMDQKLEQLENRQIRN